MEQFAHRRPEQTNREDKEKRHEVDLVIDGEKVGNASFIYYTKPFPFYYIKLIQVNEPYRGYGYSSKIMKHLEEMLMQKGKAGVLHDAIDESSPAKGMYERRGWRKVVDREMYVFNPPEGADIECLRTIALRGLDI